MWGKNLPGLFKDVLETETKKQSHRSKAEIRTEATQMTLPESCPYADIIIAITLNENTSPKLNFKEFWGFHREVSPYPTPVHQQLPFSLVLCGICASYLCVHRPTHVHVHDTYTHMCIHITHTHAHIDAQHTSNTHTRYYSHDVESRLYVAP